MSEKPGQYTFARPRLEIERDGQKVTLTFLLADHYAAIEFYEELCNDARHGGVFIDIETRAVSG